MNLFHVNAKIHYSRGLSGQYVPPREVDHHRADLRSKLLSLRAGS